MKRRWAWRPRASLRWRVAINALLYVSTGVVQTIAIQTILYSGAGDRLTFLVAIPQYAGITMVFFAGQPLLRLLARIGGDTHQHNHLHHHHHHHHHTDFPDSTQPSYNHISHTNPPLPKSLIHTPSTSSTLNIGIPQDLPPSKSPPITSSAANLISVPPASAHPAPPATAAPPAKATPTTTTAAPHSNKTSIWTTLTHPERRKLYVLAVNEVGGFIAGLTGLALAGSGLYQVIHSGVTVFTAILSHIFLKKQLSLLHWIAVLIITAGLLLTAGGAGATPTTFKPPNISAAATARASAAAATAASTILTGVSFSLISCLFYACNYVIAEYLLDETRRNPDETAGLQLPPPSGKDLSLITGGSCFLIFSIYILLHTVPQWHTLVTVSIERHHGHRIVIFLCYFGHFAASYLHAVTHYDIVSCIGAVPLGVMQGIRAITVFAVSSLLFCAEQSSQCYTPRKGMATAIVICGALLYNFASSRVTRPALASSSALPIRTSTASNALPSSAHGSTAARVALRRKESNLNLQV